jgi:hypothetical protein
MLVLVVCIMDVRMGMFHGSVTVLMLVVLGEVQPHAGGHERARDHQLIRYRLA